jgi:hypothetical protein
MNSVIEQQCKFNTTLHTCPLIYDSFYGVYRLADIEISHGWRYGLRMYTIFESQKVLAELVSGLYIYTYV